MAYNPSNSGDFRYAPVGEDYLLWLNLVVQQDDGLVGYEEWLLGWTEREDYYCEEARRLLGR